MTKNFTRRLLEGFFEMACCDFLIGRYSVGGANPGPAERNAITPAGAQPWPVVDRRIVLGPGKYTAAAFGAVTANNNNGYNWRLLTTTGGGNMSEYSAPAAFAAFPTLVAAWSGTDADERLWFECDSEPAPPTFFNINLYIIRLGDA